MNTQQLLSQMYLEQWCKIRLLTSAYVQVLQPSDLTLTLPFPESQSVFAQFHCMIGAQESYTRELQAGAWQGFTSSLSYSHDLTPALIQEHMQRADDQLKEVVTDLDLTQQQDNGKYYYEVMQTMIEHEMHHHGQLINFMYCHRFPIPHSWFLKWHLTRDE